MPGAEHYLAEGIWHHNTGKTVACCEKLHICASSVPGVRCLMVRKTRESMTETVLQTFEDDVLPEGSALARGPQRNNRQAYRYPNGSEIVVGGLDKSSKIMGSKYDLIYVSEATELTEADWEVLSSRLRNYVLPYQQLLADCNPSADTHWLNRRCERGATERLRSRYEDNPKYHDGRDWTREGRDYVLGTLERLTGVRHKRLRLGLWAAAEGQVYDAWDPHVHLIPKRPVPYHWRRIRVIDFGYQHPFVCGWIAIDEDGRMYLYRQLYMTQRLVADHAPQIVALSAEEKIEANIADHDAEDRATLARHGIQTRPAYKAVSEGIQAVQERLRPAGDGRPRLFGMRDSLVEVDRELVQTGVGRPPRPWSTEQEFEGYVWQQQPGGGYKDEPVKENDHGMDMLRYAVAYVDKLGEGRRRPTSVNKYGGTDHAQRQR